MPDDLRQEPEYILTFRNGALTKLKELAVKLDIPPESLSEVVVKGMKLLDLASDGKLVIEKGQEKLEIDLKKI